MLMTTEWHPFFSYEWWADIGTPALGAIATGVAALGSVAVGVGALLVARQGNRLAQSIAEREASSTAAAARAQFGMEAKAWMDLRFAGFDSGDPMLAVDAADSVELNAQAVGQSAPALRLALLRETQRLSDRDRAFDFMATKLQRATVLSLINAWVRDPKEWEEQERQALNARVAKRAQEASETGPKRED